MTSPAVPLPPGTPQPGQLLAGKYRIDGILGAGGMGVVLAATHVDLGQPVAIKFLNAQFCDNAEIAARFLREARAAAAIKSEHVARVLDVTRTDEGVLYIVMEHLAGSDLEQVVRARGPLPIAEAIDYVLQACEAIAEAHAAHIVHRDLKPGNLFLTQRADGSPLVKVLDFGMSKMAAMEGGPHDGSLTSPVAMLGSPWYMSPEQIKSSRNVDHRTDVWSLGIILHKLLTGAPAFEAETLSSCLVKIVTEPPATLRTRRPDAPAELEIVILRCLEKDLGRRLQNVAELAWALLPFAPERSRVSVERIVRVLLGSDVLDDKTLPLSAAAAAPFTPAPGPAPARAPTARTPPVSASPLPERSTAGLASAPAPPATPAPRWLLAAAAGSALLAGAGLLLLRSLRAPSGELSAATTSALVATAPVEAPPPVASLQEPTAQPAPATSEAVQIATASARTPPFNTGRPRAPSVPAPKPATPATPPARHPGVL